MASIEFLEDDLGCLFFVSTHTEGFLYRSFTASGLVSGGLSAGGHSDALVDPTNVHLIDN